MSTIPSSGHLVEQKSRVELESPSYQDGIIAIIRQLLILYRYQESNLDQPPIRGATLPLSYSEVFIISTISFEDTTLHFIVISSILFFGIS